MFARCCTATARWGRENLFTLLAALGGLCSAGLLLAARQQVYGLLGMSAPVVWGAELGGALTLGLLWQFCVARSRTPQAAWRQVAAACLGLALTAACLPFATVGLDLLVAWSGPGWTASPWSVGLVAAVVAAGLGGVPAGLAASLAENLARCAAADQGGPLGVKQPGRLPGPWLGFLLGAACALLLQAALIGPLVGLMWPTLVAGSLIAAIGFWAGVDGWRTGPLTRRLAGTPVNAGEPAAPLAGLEGALLAGVGLGVGGLAAAGERLLRQELLATTALSCAEWAWAIVGVVAGLWIAGRRPDLERGRPGWSGLLTAAWAVGLIALFPWMVLNLLWMNSHGSWHQGLHAFRAIVPAVWDVPLGLVLGLAAGSQWRSTPRGLWLAAGVMLGRLAGQTGFAAIGAAWVAILAAWVLGAIGVALLATRGPRPHRRLRWAAPCAVALLAAAPLWRGQYRPDLSAKVLFSSQATSLAYQGRPLESLAYLDESRLAAVAEGPRGTWTLWKCAAQQIQWRLNGVPQGSSSLDVGIFPNDSAELLLGLVPLVLHQRPDRVLVLGSSGGVPLEVCLAAPVLQIDCVEGDPLRRKLLKSPAFHSGRIDWSDERLTTRTLDPALFLATTDARFDVIVASAELSATESGALGYTREHYARAARCLAEDGIFCQRFQYFDYGPAPLATAARTMREAFGSVQVLAAGPGEMLLLGTNAPDGLIRPGLLARTQATHVREILRQANWDWSVLLTLAAYDGDALAALAPAPHTRMNAWFAFALPLEIARWGAKPTEVAETLGPHIGRWLDQIGPEAEHPVLLRRFAEVRGQQELLMRNPDQFWAYRSSVREQVSRHPKSLLNHALFDPDDQSGLDPEDRRRMQYFKALGRAASSKRPEQIQQVARFADPYDPLLSYFVHGEVAELYARGGHVDPAEELRHRLHTIYYASPLDRSVVNVIDAINLILDHPAAIPDPLARWDQLNALVQALQHRWEARGRFNSGSPAQTMRDVELSLRAIDRTCAALDTLVVEAGCSPTDWKQRRAAIEINLARPLGGYRDQLRPFVGRQQILAESPDDETL